MSDSTVVGREQCPKCAEMGLDSSGDNLARYSDGHGYCFACEHYEHGNSSSTPSVNVPERKFESYRGTIKDLPHRRIDDKTCRMYNYQSVTINGRDLEIENFYDLDGQLQAQHIRDVATKRFKWVGDTTNLPFFGQHLFESGGKRITITEGAIDCLSMSKLFGNKYPVVSIPNGVNSAVKAVKNNYEFISSFETIVICFDMDDPGQKAAREVAELLPPGKVKIMSLPRKDANEMLVHGESQDLLQAYWNAKSHNPDSILHVSSVLDNKADKNEVYEFPWDSMTEFMIGQDSGRLYLWTSATGHGKSSIIRELVIHHLSENRPVGCVFLEESPQQTVDDLISLKLGKPVRRIMGQRQLNELRKSKNKEEIDLGVDDTLTDEEYNTARNDIAQLPLYLYDHIGNTNIGNVLSRLEYMAVGVGCKVLIVDHITLLGNMLLSSDHSDNNSERLVLDETMKNLRALVERTGVVIHVVSHIRKTDKSVDEGERISLNDLRGSGSLAQISDYVLALERNRQHADEKISNTTCIRVLKNRKTGKCGICTALWYNHKTSRLEEIDFTVTPEGEVLYQH